MIDLLPPPALESPNTGKNSNRFLCINYSVVRHGVKNIRYLNGEHNAFIYTRDSLSNVCCSSLPQELFISDSGLLHRSCGKGLELCTDWNKQRERNTTGQ